jgi:hypothetical protein
MEIIFTNGEGLSCFITELECNYLHLAKHGILFGLSFPLNLNGVTPCGGCATLVMSCLCIYHYRRLVLAKKGDFTRKATPLCPGMAS